MSRRHYIPLLAMSAASTANANGYKIDDSSCGDHSPACPVFDGLGALSGGGATSILLPHFPEAQRDAIMDYLFKPNFGASLQVLKVEIGGDSESGCGAEPSHMHTPFDEDYNRGYEWFVMKEARKRNPNIKLWGLSWAWPQWVACNVSNFPASCNPGKNSPYVHVDQAVGYIVKWVEGAKRVHNLTIDYVGDWNERTPSNDYLKALRKGLDAAGLQSTKIPSWDNVPTGDLTNFYHELLADPELSAAVYSVGLHYPGTTTWSQQLRPQLQQKLWASEDDSTYNGLSGAGCWGRIINENYVHGNMTSSIHWNLAAAYQKGTNWYRMSIMNALQPWGGGSYGIWRADGVWSAGAKVWVSAHTTQFTEPDTFRYLPVSGTGTSGGAGPLKEGGSYVTFKNFDTNDFTVVIEKMARDRSYCVRPGLSNFNTSAEMVELEFDGMMLPADGSSVRLYIWKSYFASTSAEKTTEFEEQTSVEVSRSKPKVVLQSVDVNSIWTVTTLNTGHKGTPAKGSEPAQASLFPTEYTNDFESCPLSSEGRYFTDQVGAWECVAAPKGPQHASHGTVMKQMVPIVPIHWGPAVLPYSFIGHRDMTDMTIEHDVYFSSESDTAILGARMQGNYNPTGAYFVLTGDGKWFTCDGTDSVNNASAWTHKGTLGASAADAKWHRLSMKITGTAVVVTFDGKVSASYTYDGGNGAGFGLFGSTYFGQGTLIDDFALVSAKYHECNTQASEITAGTKLSVVECGTEVGIDTSPKRQWIFDGADKMNPDGTGDMSAAPSVFKFAANPDLCLEIPSKTSPAVLAKCDPTKDAQLFSWFFSGVSANVERLSFFTHNGTGMILDLERGANIGSAPILQAKWSDINYRLFYDVETHELSSEQSVTCIGVC